MTKQTKIAEADMKKLAEVDGRDREQAYEMGFAKCAHDLGLSREEFGEFYNVACNKLAAQEDKKQG